MADVEKMKKLSKKHLLKPKVGDYWHECFHGYFVVSEVHDWGVVVFDQKISIDEHSYKFDETKPKPLTKEEFKKKVTYSTMPDEFVAFVIPAKG